MNLFIKHFQKMTKRAWNAGDEIIRKTRVCVVRMFGYFFEKQLEILA